MQLLSTSVKHLHSRNRSNCNLSSKLKSTHANLFRLQQLQKLFYRNVFADMQCRKFGMWNAFILPSQQNIHTTHPQYIVITSVSCAEILVTSRCWTPRQLYKLTSSGFLLCRSHRRISNEIGSLHQRLSPTRDVCFPSATSFRESCWEIRSLDPQLATLLQ